VKVRETNKATFPELSKSQNIRVIDVFFIGPFLIYIASKATGISDIERTIIYIIAIATIIYNARNYISNKVNRYKGFIR
jgi:hypothetical protein